MNVDVSLPFEAIQEAVYEYVEKRLGTEYRYGLGRVNVELYYRDTYMEITSAKIMYTIKEKSDD